MKRIILWAIMLQAALLAGARAHPLPMACSPWPLAFEAAFWPGNWGDGVGTDRNEWLEVRRSFDEIEARPSDGIQPKAVVFRALNRDGFPVSEIRRTREPFVAAWSKRGGVFEIVRIEATLEFEGKAPQTTQMEFEDDPLWSRPWLFGFPHAHCR